MRKVRSSQKSHKRAVSPEAKVRGANPETLAIPGNWQAAMKKAVAKPRPAAGWPERQTRTYKKKRRRKAK
jgi:hypothetical protein